MNIKFWGTRGSIPSPGENTVKYGGNTTCLEVTLKSGRTIIIDAGTGIRLLSNDILKRDKSEVDLFLTHSHWDHIQGFPFFIPIYKSNFKIKIYAASPTYDRLMDIMKGQMKYLYFPVPFKEIGAKVEFRKIEDTGIKIDGVYIRSILTNHPLETHAFRFEEGDKIFTIMTDNELGNQDIAKVSYPEHLEFAEGSDILVHDAQYTEEEIDSHRGWGHSSCKEAIEFAGKAGVKTLFFTHYDPNRKDKEVDKLIKDSNKYSKNNLEVKGARENLDISV